MRKLIFLILLFSFTAIAQLPAESKIIIKGRSLFSYYTNHSIKKVNSKIERAIITIHGSVRNADTYFKSVWGLSKKRQVEDKTLVISPHFKISGDQIAKDELVFDYEGWWIGDDSLNSILGTAISSFDVIDFFINHLANRDLFPNLKTLIITGHSAGGHLTQRLALGSIEDLDIQHLEIKYVVANPGTYAYLTPSRPVAGQRGIFAIPARPRCRYNSWKYGLENLNPYMSVNDIPYMIQNFIKRDVTYFLGEEDTGDVEQSCQARWQGPHRFARGQNFKDHVDMEYPENNHSIITVPGVGHTQYGMYTSALGQKLLFQ
jgi:hypothetical protein